MPWRIRGFLLMARWDEWLRLSPRCWMATIGLLYPPLPLPPLSPQLARYRGHVRLNS